MRDLTGFLRLLKTGGVRDLTGCATWADNYCTLIVARKGERPPPLPRIGHFENHCHPAKDDFGGPAKVHVSQRIGFSFFAKTHEFTGDTGHFLGYPWAQKYPLKVQIPVHGTFRDFLMKSAKFYEILGSAKVIIDVRSATWNFLKEIRGIERVILLTC